MQTCGACGAECRKARLALVVPDGKRRRVCKRCVDAGVLVVARSLAPVVRQESLFSADPLEEVSRTVKAWSGMSGQAPGGGDYLYQLGRREAFEAVTKLIQRTKETGT